MAHPLRERRLRKGLSQGQLAQKVGCHRSYIHLLETGQRIPGLDLAGLLADFFGVSIEALFPRAHRDYRKERSSA